MIIQYAMRSCQGDRDYNEDTIRMHEAVGRRIYVLADGLGGCGHGVEASLTAVKSVLGRFAWDENREGFLASAVEGAQEAVLEKQRRDPGLGRMSTTLVVLEITEDRARWAHIGDSRLYMFRKNKVLSQTLDHSVPQMLVRMGEIQPSDIRRHPDRSRLLRVIGHPWEGTPYVVGNKIQIQSGDAFLLCSDGLWEFVEEETMCAILRDSARPDQWLDEMMKTARENGKGKNMDNYSAICVQIQ